MMTNTAKDLSIQDLAIRIPLPPAKDELRELAETFNSMMDRLEDSVRRLRRFTGDVSHELRTPKNWQFKRAEKGMTTSLQRQSLR